MYSTTETVKEVIDKLGCSQVFAAKPSWKRYTIVIVVQSRK
jgi:hypothetical protein